jgi:parallel beta-helix repeat protein
VQSAFVVEKDNIVINGAGYTLQGTFNGTKDVEWTVGQGPYNETEALPWTVGIDLTDRSQGNLTIRNLNVKNFSIGLFIWTSNNTITGNSVTDNVVGIMLSESSNNIIGNYIANNEEGIFLAVNSAGCYAENMTCYRNSLVNNVKQVSGCQCTDPVENCTTYSTNIWDNDKEGNYWSDYTGVDNDKNGKGDSPYIIDIKNQDRYPLMESAASLPTANPEFPTTLVLTAVASVAVVGAGLLFYFRKHNH